MHAVAYSKCCSRLLQSFHTMDHLVSKFSVPRVRQTASVHYYVLHCPRACVLITQILSVTLPDEVSQQCSMQDTTSTFDHASISKKNRHNCHLCDLMVDKLRDIMPLT